MLDSPVMADREELDENTKLLYVGLFRLRRQKHAVLLRLVSDKSRLCERCCRPNRGTSDLVAAVESCEAAFGDAIVANLMNTVDLQHPG